MTAARVDFLEGHPDGEWQWYVRGHDEGELLQIDDLDVLEWEKCWMREVTEDERDDEETPDDCSWVECMPGSPGAEPWIGAKYAPV